MLADSKEWRLKFIYQLERLPEERKDKHIRRLLLSDEDTRHQVASFVEFYVHKRTDALNKERKARGRRMKARLRAAINGTRVAADLFLKNGEQDKHALLAVLVEELRERLSRADEAFATKRLGVSADHSIPLALEGFLEARIGGPIPMSTLATLLEVGHLTDGESKDIEIDCIRKNLSNFRKRNSILARLIHEDMSHPPHLVNPINIPQE